MTGRSIIHATFNIDRVFEAFSDYDAKKLWFGGPPEWDQGEHTLDFRVGGWEVEEGGPPGGPEDDDYEDCPIRAARSSGSSGRHWPSGRSPMSRGPIRMR